MPYIPGDQTTYLEGDAFVFLGSRVQRLPGLMVVVAALAPGAQNAYCLNWQNPNAFKILVQRLMVHEKVAGGTAGALLDFGMAAATATPSDNLIDGMDGNLAGLYDNIEDRGVNGKTRQIVDENGGANDWITGQILVAAAGALAGYVYIYYTRAS